MKEELVGRYCSASSPGPVVSLADVAVGLKVFLHTDSKDVYSGFLGKYMFFPAKSTEKKGIQMNFVVLFQISIIYLNIYLFLKPNLVIVTLKLKIVEAT